ncbi:MAG: metallophosphoesterase [Chitinophagaceae bacterium]|nr:metallophosphoesterase [Chitinophagaceae bacterium]
MRKFLKKILGPLLTRLASNASAPDKKDVFNSLSKLLRNLRERPGKRGLKIEVDFLKDKFIVFSDHHKGNKDHGDDFANNEPNYLAALDYYFANKYTYINLGDAEELWKYKPQQVISKNMTALKKEACFQRENRYHKTFGNHDLTWKNKIDVDIWFKDIFTLPLPVWEGLLLNTNVNGEVISIFLTHGHQGDKMSDNNALSTWLVSHLWRPLQRYLQLNVNTPAKDYTLRDKHNIMMYEWSSRKKNLLLITGHTHKPVFASGRYSNHSSNEIDPSLHKHTLRPSYFNSGCCCYNDTDITGIEICEGKISLIKWHLTNAVSNRTVLEEIALADLAKELMK